MNAMSTLQPINYSHSPALQGFQRLEAHEDWLIQVIDTLGHSLHRPESRHHVQHCLENLQQGLQRFFAEEPVIFAHLGRPLSEEHRLAHRQLLLRLDELSRRHARGESIGHELLQQMQQWLMDHCGQLH